MRGHARAQERLATRYLRGEGVAKDRVKAMAWYSLAAERGSSSADQNMKALRVELTNEQVDAAAAYATELGKKISN